MTNAYYEDNSLCEICVANENVPLPDKTGWFYWINQHCIDLRRNREARKHKNYKPTLTVF